MSDDIVARLRELDKELVEDEEVIADFSCVEQAADEIERLRADRDEARRRVCWLEAEMYGIFGDKDRLVVHRASYMPSDAAKEFGWDCFKEAADA